MEVGHCGEMGAVTAESESLGTRLQLTPVLKNVKKKHFAVVLKQHNIDIAAENMNMEQHINRVLKVDRYKCKHVMSFILFTATYYPV